MANEQKIMLGKKTGGYILLSELTIRKFLEKSGISNGDIDKILQWLLDNGGGSGGSGTSVPTSNTTAKFDIAKHMNSEDMTDAEITNFIDRIPGGSSLLDFFYPVGSYYETSDANFDPNTALGGTWNKETTDIIERRKLIWTSSVYTDFAAQTISMDLSNYTFAEVEFYASSNTDIFVPNALKIRTGENGAVILMHNLKGNGTNENTGARRINVSTSGVTFTDYTYKNRRTGGTLTVANQFCVPRRIYGIKEITEYRWHRTA